MKPFLNNLWDGELVLKKFGLDAYVYPCDNVFNAYKVSEARVAIELFNNHVEEILEDDILIKHIRSELDQIVSKIKTESGLDLSDPNSSVMEYLSATKMSLVKFREEYDASYLCWPEKESKNLAPCFKEYPIYKFYESYHPEIKNGVHLFLQLIPFVKEPIQQAKIEEPFLWDTVDVEFLNIYNDAVNHLSGPFYTRSTETHGITADFLRSNGYNFLGYENLPDWFSLFEGAVEKVPAYRFNGYEFHVTIYFSPKGPFLEAVSDETETKTYKLIKVAKDALNFDGFGPSDELPF